MLLCYLLHIWHLGGSPRWFHTDRSFLSWYPVGGLTPAFEPEHQQLLFQDLISVGRILLTHFHGAIYEVMFVAWDHENGCEPDWRNQNFIASSNKFFLWRNTHPQDPPTFNFSHKTKAKYQYIKNMMHSHVLASASYIFSLNIPGSQKPVSASPLPCSHQAVHMPWVFTF